MLLKKKYLSKKDEPVVDEEPVSESEEQVQDEVVESERRVVPTDVSEEDAESLGYFARR